MRRRIGPGAPEPLGVTPVAGGVNVAVFSVHAGAIEWCLFDARGEREIERVVLPERTGDVWHGFVAEVAPATRYGLRAHGPFAPNDGHRFDAAKLLVDPYARALDRPFALHPALFSVHPDGVRNHADSAPFVPKGIVTALPTGTTATPLDVPWSRTILYELHVRGFTKRHPAVPEPLRGTCAALATPAAIGHLQRLGVTTVELMPVAAAIDERHLSALRLTNYWGYNPIALFVPDPRLAPGGIAELAAAVAALHAAGIEVLLDVVMNHTGEGDQLGPTVSFRGLDNSSYYRLPPDDRSRYLDDAGCGNTLACERPHVVRLVLDALRHYVLAANVDGFRFDLATTLGRARDGFDPAAPLLAAIAQDPLLRVRKLVVEPWDLGPGGYRLGAFHASWGEWNDRYRDTLRRFVRGDAGLQGEAATRVAGSADVFASRSRPLSRSVNFVAAHDGFTLADLVAHVHKHNEDNGERNRDGADRNESWNHGVEGATDDPTIRAARVQDVRSLIAALIFSRGTPMLAMGDELGRTQRGNNNAYAQDGPLTWIDWDTADEGLCRFTARVCALRRAHPALRDEAVLTGDLRDDSGIPDVEWRRPDGAPMGIADWQDPNGCTLIASLYTPERESEAADRIVVVLHFGATPLDIRLPDARDGFGWRRDADSAASGNPGDGEWLGAEATVAPRSVVLFTEMANPTASLRVSGIEPAALARLARAAGIAADWWDVRGTRYATSPDTERALLASMGLAVQSTADARAHLVALARARRRALPASLVILANQPGEIAVATTATGRGTFELRVAYADGSASALTVDTANANTLHTTNVEGRPLLRAVVPLPALPPGVHTISLADDPSCTCTVVATPGRCHVPAALRDGRRAFGVAAHLYSLRRATDLGIGDFTTLRDLVRESAAHGAATIALNPLHALFAAERERASPYHPSDRRFLDPIYIDIEGVADFAATPSARAMLERRRAEVGTLSALGRIDYPRVWALKRELLAACHRTFLQRDRRDPLRQDFDRFVAVGGLALARFALFEAIAALHPQTPWQAWPHPLRSAEGAAASDIATRHADAVQFALYLQWLADGQLAAAAGAARTAGLALGLYRDLAIGAAPDGAEVWCDTRGFVSGVSVGAPPDPFNPQGQIWNLPPPNPLTLADDGYARFRTLLAANLRHAGALRIDHAMGLARLFFVPDGAPAREGTYVEYPLEDLLGVLALESQRHRALIVGEDLGTVPAGLRERLDAADVYSSVVVWLEREGRDFHGPEHWRRKAVASVSTHDLPTIAGWWRGADIAERQAIAPAATGGLETAQAERALERDCLAHTLREAHALADRPADSAEVAAALHRMLAASPAALVLVQADDLAGEVDALNLPGTDRERPNWRRRLAVEVDAIWSTPIGQAAAQDLRERSAPPDTSA